jgi:hypothetical protein
VKRHRRRNIRNTEGNGQRGRAREDRWRGRDRGVCQRGGDRGEGSEGKRQRERQRGGT